VSFFTFFLRSKIAQVHTLFVPQSVATHYAYRLNALFPIIKRTPQPKAAMSFKQTFEKNLNKELEDEHPEPSSPPPPIDVEYQQNLPPPQVFASYPPPPRRSGVHIPTPFFFLLVLLFLFESGIIFVYTLVGLFNTLPAGIIPMPGQACNCAPTTAPINVVPNIYVSRTLCRSSNRS